MFCRYCGGEITNGEKYCGMCGKPTNVNEGYNQQQMGQQPAMMNGQQMGQQPGIWKPIYVSR